LKTLSDKNRKEWSEKVALCQEGDDGGHRKSAGGEKEKEGKWSIFNSFYLEKPRINQLPPTRESSPSYTGNKIARRRNVAKQTTKERKGEKHETTIGSVRIMNNSKKE
jgi:hypothetical protein